MKEKPATLEQPKSQTRFYVLLTIVVVVTLFLWCVPTSFYGIDGLTLTEQRTIAIFVFAALMWMFEIIPAWTTSVLITVIMLFTISTCPLPAFKSGDPQRLGTLVNYKSLLATFADQTVMLFLGGFILANACTKVGLDVRLARALLKLFGKKSENVLLGFLFVIAILSMFMSNTATAAMMLSFLVPVLKTLPADGKGRIGLALSIPVAANIGGLGTPIGTPPNAIVNAQLGIGFGEWMLHMVPYVLVMLIIAWRILLWLFPFKQKVIDLKIEDHHQTTWQTWVVGITFAITVLLWVTEELTGLNCYVVAMFPVAVFCVTGVITKRELGEIEWSVLWMVAGGFALGLAMNATGLAEHLVNSLPFGSWSPIVVLIVPGLIAYFISNFISNTASANLLVPIVSAVAVGMGSSLDTLGGASALLMCVAMCCSLAMLLPISTPPNAIAHSTGLLATKDMVKIGLPIGIIGMVLAYLMLIFIGI